MNLLSMQNKIPTQTCLFSFSVVEFPPVGRTNCSHAYALQRKAMFHMSLQLST